MKGVFIQQQLEFRLEVQTDGAHQGDSLPCTLTVTNHATAPQTIPDLFLELALGDIKGVREKQSDSLRTIASATIEQPWVLEPGMNRSTAWTFTLDMNCAISDKSQSIYLLYGRAAGPRSELPLIVEAHQDIDAILRILETSFQFVPRGRKSAKDWVEVKLKPSTAPKYSVIDELTLKFHFDGPDLLSRYVFRVKQFNIGSTKGEIKKDKKEVEQRLSDQTRRLQGGYVNHEALERSIDEALSTVATGI